MLIQKINKLFNIESHEWARVTLSWTLGLLIRSSYVIAWTLIMALFISRHGLESLAVLFIINALGIILGTVVYSELLRHFDEKKVTIYTSILASISFLTAFYLFNTGEETIFLAILLLALSVFLTQLFILINLFIEKLFSPLESQRTFPVIESYEAVGGILGGLIIGSLASQAPLSIFLLIVGIATIFIAILIHAANQKIHTIPVLEFNQNKDQQHRGLKIKSYPFAKSLAFIILFQFVLFTLVEFQFAAAISSEVNLENQQEISQEENKIAFIPEHLTTSILQAKQNSDFGERTHQSTEGDIAHLLGLVVMLASLSALVVQLFLSSRILNRLGIIKSMIFHPVLIALNSIILLWNFGMLAGSSLKIGFEVSYGIFNNSYHSSYYCLKEKDRSQIKEFLDGIMKPIGIILATFILWAAYYFNILSLINYSLIIFSVLLFGIMLRTREQYTNLSLENIEEEGDDLITKENAIEILSQKGHRDISDELIKKLKSKQINENLKVKIITALSLIGQSSSITTVIKCLEDDSKEIQLAAIKAIKNYSQNYNFFLDKAFTKYQVVKALKANFQRENDGEIKTEIIRTLVELHEKEVIEFIINILDKSKDNKILSSTIEICQVFEDDCLAEYMQKFLMDSDLKIRANTMIALWKFEKYRDEIKTDLNEMFQSNKKEKLIAAFHISGEIGSKDKISFLQLFLNSNDLEIRRQAAISLIKLESNDAIKHLTKLIVHENSQFAIHTKEIVSKLKPQLQKLIRSQLNLEIGKKINQLLEGHSHKDLQKLPHHILNKLKHYYQLVDQIEESLKLDALSKLHSAN